MKATVLKANQNPKGDQSVACPNEGMYSRQKDGTINVERCLRCAYLREVGPDYVKCLYNQVEALPDQIKRSYFKQPSQDEVQ